MKDKININVNLIDIQNKIYGETVHDFSIKDLENAKREWIYNLIEIGAKSVEDTTILNDLCNFLNNIEFKEENILEDINYKISLIDKFINETRKEYNFRMKRFIETVKNNNNNYANLQQFIDDLFLINELNRFLENEKESFKLNLNTHLNTEEYKKLAKSVNLIDDFTGIYYNSDYGTSYEDITRILKDIIYVLYV